MASDKVVLKKGVDRYRVISEALEELKPEIKKALTDKKEIAVKVNLTSVKRQLAVTNVETVRAFLDFVKPIFKGRIRLVEMTARREGFTNFGFEKLVDSQVIIDDLADDRLKRISLYDPDLKKTVAAKAFATGLEADYLVSITPAKTHDTGGVTLSLKNVAVGFLKTPSLVHQGYRAFNKNIALLARMMPVDLAIIDGVEGMEGDGPIDGMPVNSQFAVVSEDAWLADVVATRAMGFKPWEIGYLYYLNKEKIREEVFVIGNKISDCRLDFCPHRTWEAQKQWRLPPTRKQRLESLVVRRVFNPMQQLGVNRALKKVFKKLQS